MTVSSIDLRDGVVVLADGQLLPITRYLGDPDAAPDDGALVEGFDWVTSVVAGPDADGDWYAVHVSDEDRETAVTAVKQ